jgi:hypothetical protein
MDLFFHNFLYNLPPFFPWIFVYQCLVLHLEFDIIQKQFLKLFQPVIRVQVVWKALLGVWQNVSNLPFNSWIYTQSSWVWFSMSMLTSINYSHCCKQVFSNFTRVFFRCMLITFILP